MDRTDEIVIPAGTSWLSDPDAQRVCQAIAAGGHRVLFVGGCVRNALLGLPDSDVDLATDAMPERTMELARAAGLKAVPTGIDHGTVTVISSGKPFEITTFRRDVATDGRRAVVAFSKNIAEDARRRDFTMNALYAAPNGQVIDPLGGLPDLLARRIRFIEDATARIREDFLRTLRFFRFFAWYGAEEQGFDPVAIDAISSNLAGLETLSAERVGNELRKLLAAPDPAFSVAGMRSTGVLHALLPGADDRLLGPVLHVEQELGLMPDWIVRLAALGGEDVETRLRLSRAETRELQQLREALDASASLEEIAYRQGANTARGALLLRAAMAGAAPGSGVLERITAAAAAQMPVNSRDLMPALRGPALGARLAEIEQKWIDSGFSLKKSELLNLP